MASRYLVRIWTPYSWGSGFVFCPGQDSGVCGIATTALILQPSRIRNDSILLEHWHSKTTRTICGAERAVYVDKLQGTAIIYLNRGELRLPDHPLPLIGPKRHLKTGVEVRLLGFSSPKTKDSFSNWGPVVAFDRRLKRHYVACDTTLGYRGGPVVYRRKDSIGIVGVIHGHVSDLEMEEARREFGSTTCIGQLNRLPRGFESIEQARSGETARTHWKNMS